jgi:hypothetical protein
MMAQQDERHVPHRPGAISMFFVAKAGVFAAGFWIWLLVVAVRDEPVTPWILIAVTGAVVTTLVSVVLGVRFALQANAAVRHAEIKKMLVEISWNTAFAVNNTETSDNVVRFPSAVHDSGGWPHRQSGHDSGGWVNRPEGGDRDRRR